MSERKIPAAEEREIVSRLVMEIVMAAVLFCFGAVVMWDSYRLGAGWAATGPASGFFPFRIGLIMCVASMGVVWHVLRKKKPHSAPIDMDGGEAAGEEADAAFLTRRQIKPVLQVFIPIVVYVLTIEFLGLYLASFALITLFMKLLGKYRWFKSLAVGLSVTVVTFYLFEIQFLVPLAKGPLEEALGF